MYKHRGYCVMACGKCYEGQVQYEAGDEVEYFLGGTGVVVWADCCKVLVFFDNDSYELFDQGEEDHIVFVKEKSHGIGAHSR